MNVGNSHDYEYINRATVNVFLKSYSLKEFLKEMIKPLLYLSKWLFIPLEPGIVIYNENPYNIIGNYELLPVFLFFLNNCVVLAPRNIRF